MDPLDDIFSAMRVRSALYARLEATAPWGVRFAARDWARFGLVVRGSCWLTLEGSDEAPIALTAGDCYVVLKGADYRIQDDTGSPTPWCYHTIGDNVGGVVTIGGGGAAATLIAGWFLFDAVGARPLMELMPPLIHARMDQDRTQILQSTLQLLSMETARPNLGSQVVISRLADILFVQAIRAYAATAETDVGWLSALSDPKLSPVFHALHARVDHPWTVESLADIAGMSRSAFAARFKARVGEAPLEYLTRWRMFRAGSHLRRGQLSIGEIAARVGYESEPAFAKAFKRVIGVAPGEYRRVHAEETAATLAIARAGAAELPSQVDVFRDVERGLA